MVITSRKDALAAGVGQYFTGKPCKYGHTSPRYTQSGTCTQCVLDAAAASRKALGATERRRVTIDARADYVAARDARATALGELITVKVPIDHTDRQTVFETAIELCLSTYPVLSRIDVQPGTTPQRGTPLYALKVPVQHVDLIREVASALWSKHVVDIDAERRRILGAVEQLADEESSEPPEGWK
jgi:hypothetical protein